MKEKNPGSSSKSDQQTDVISLLLQDHESVLQMFDDFKKLSGNKNADDNEKQNLVDLACNALTIHTQLEEEIVYPALRDSIAEGMLVEQALVEHQSATQLINELQMMQAGDELYDAKFMVLADYARHHINEEQDKIFPQAQKTKLDLMAMGEQLLQRKQELQEEMGLAQNGESPGGMRDVAEGDAGRAGLSS